MGNDILIAIAGFAAFCGLTYWGEHINGADIPFWSRVLIGTGFYVAVISGRPLLDRLFP